MYYWDDQSRFEYWNDIEYDTDGYNDVLSKNAQRTSTSAVKRTSARANTRKRKARDTSLEVKSVGKKRKVQDSISAPEEEIPPVLFLKKDRFTCRTAPRVDTKLLPEVAVLPDWRERFAKGKMPALQVQPMVNATAVDEDDMEEDEYDDDDADGLPDIPKDALQAALQRHLGSLGLDTANVKQDILLQLAERMMAGDDEGNDLLDELVEGIHGGEEE